MASEIREYTTDDLEACRELWRHLTQRHRDIYDDQTIGGDDPGPSFDQHYLADERPAKVWVAEVDGSVVGMCGLLLKDGEAELEPIVVRPDERDRGIGALLAQTAIAEATRLGVPYINVRPVGRNIEAIAFFNREGFEILGRLELSKRITAKPSHGPDRTLDIHGRSFQY